MSRTRVKAWDRTHSILQPITMLGYDHAPTKYEAALVEHLTSISREQLTRQTIEELAWLVEAAFNVGFERGEKAHRRGTTRPTGGDK